MVQPRVCVLRAPGTNCDLETAEAFRLSGADPERVHLFRLLEEPARLADFQILCIPGGFSFGDDIGAGVIFSRELRGRLNDALNEFVAGDRLTLGICNGFQVLMKAGLFSSSEASDDQPEATLTWNENQTYTCLWVRLKVRSTNSVFLRGIDEVDMPLAHAEGRIAVRDNSVLEAWRENDQIAVCYTQPEGGLDAPDTIDPLPYPANPNGSLANIAGLTDQTGRVLGLMPHPERFMFATQHPQWTRLGLRGDGDGLQVFRNAVEYFG